MHTCFTHITFSLSKFNGEIKLLIRLLLFVKVDIRQQLCKQVSPLTEVNVRVSIIINFQTRSRSDGIVSVSSQQSNGIGCLSTKYYIIYLQQHKIFIYLIDDPEKFNRNLRQNSILLINAKYFFIQII